MTGVRIDGKLQRPVSTPSVDELSIDRLRTIVQDSHLSFLIGAGTPSAFFGLLGDIENALTELNSAQAPEQAKRLVRASIQAYFFDRVLAPNKKLVDQHEDSRAVLDSYSQFLRTINRILLRRRSSLLGKQVNIFTTNVDLAFEVALENMGIDFSDGFSGKIQPKFDLGEYGSLHYRQGTRYEHRSEVPVINLYKIHGSAGWKQVERSDTLVDIIFDHGLTLVEAARERLEAARGGLLEITAPEQVDTRLLLARAGTKVLTADGEEFLQAYSALAIVNPDKEKFSTTVLNETYYELIRRFANELEKENCVLFVHGFSFRDEHLRKLVVRAARTNPTLQIIIFCYSRNDRTSFEKLIPDIDVKNGNILYVVPPEAKGGEIEEGLSLDVIRSRFLDPIVPEQRRQPDQKIELDIKTGAREEPDA